MRKQVLAQLDASYEAARKLNKVSVAREQGGSGSCWALGVRQLHKDATQPEINTRQVHIDWRCP